MSSNPEILAVTAMLMVLDKTKLGLFTPEGRRLDPASFSKWTAELQRDEGSEAFTPAEALYDGDPGKIKRFEANGLPSHDFLE